MSIFIFLKNAFEFFLLLSQGTTIPKIRIPGQKMWAGWYRIKLLHASGIRNRALSLLCRDLLGYSLKGIPSTAAGNAAGLITIMSIYTDSLSLPRQEDTVPLQCQSSVIYLNPCIIKIQMYHSHITVKIIRGYTR